MAGGRLSWERLGSDRGITETDAVKAKAKEKAPAYQWYPKDWKSDSRVQRMTYEQRGIYRELLDTQWLEGCLPSDTGELARMLGVPQPRFEKVWPLILECFSVRETDGKLVQKRLERVRRERDDFIRHQRTAGKMGARKRWQKGRHSDPIAGGHRSPNGD